MRIKETLYQGGYLRTDLLNANYIKASIVNADYINALDIVSKSIRTATTGKRIEILESTNNMIFYDSRGNQTILVDDDIQENVPAGTTPVGGIKFQHPDYQAQATISSNGIFGNGSTLEFLFNAGFQNNCSVLGILTRKNQDSAGISAGIVGRDASGGSIGNSKTYAGYFEGDTMLNGNIYTKNIDGGIQQGISGSYASTTRFIIRNGLIVGTW